MNLKKILTIIALVSALGGLIGTVFALDSRYAKEVPTQQQIIALNHRIDIIKLEDELICIKQRMFAIEDRWAKKFKEEFNRYHNSIEELLAFMPKEYRDEYRELERKKIEIEKKIEKLKED